MRRQSAAPMSKADWTLLKSLLIAVRKQRVHHDLASEPVKVTRGNRIACKKYSNTSMCGRDVFTYSGKLGRTGFCLLARPVPLSADIAGLDSTE